MLKRGSRLAVVFAAFTGLVASAFVPPTVAAGPRIDLKVLLISADGTEPSYQAWRAALEREGVPFSTLVASSAAPLTAAQLSEGRRAYYQAVVLATDDLVRCDETSCASAFGSEEWEVLAKFERSFGIRRLDAFAYPKPDIGLNYPTFAGDLGGSVASVTQAGASAFSYLAGRVPVGPGSYGYLATPKEGSTYQTLVAAPTGEPLVGVYHRPDGRQEMVITVGTNPSALHHRLLAHGLLTWLTRGIHFGYARNYLSMQIDDVFLPDDRWDAVQNTTHEDDCATVPCIRMTPADVSRALTWQKANGFQFDFAFNGAGSVEAGAGDPLTASLLRNKTAFRWTNHTYSHRFLGLDPFTGTWVTSAEIIDEIARNKRFARDHRIPIREDELVTGEHSGLDNPYMAAALREANITAIASDASRAPVQQPLGPALTVPRHPNNLFYNVATVAEWVDEYNWMYYEHCTPSAVTTCRTSPATIDDILAVEAEIILVHVTGNDPRPGYAHQSNLAEDGTIYRLLDEVLRRYRSYFTAPLVQPTLSDSRITLSRAANWKAATADNQVAGYMQDGKVYVTSSATTTVPVTVPSGTMSPSSGGLLGGLFGRGGQPFGEAYGGERSAWASVGRNSPLELRLPA